MRKKGFVQLLSMTQEGLRSKALKAIMNRKKQIDVAKPFVVTYRGVRKWVREKREGGEKVLGAKRGGRLEGGCNLAWKWSQIFTWSSLDGSAPHLHDEILRLTC